MVNMKLFLLLSSLVIVQANVIKEYVVINGIRHEKQVLIDNLDSVSRLTTDSTSNELYFSYRKEERYRVAKSYFNYNEYEDIEGSTNLSGAAVDPESHKVYIGGHDGLYKYNNVSNIAELEGTNGLNNVIWNMFFKNVLYFVALPSNFLYTYVNGQFSMFSDVDRKVDNFVIDNDDVMYFSYYSKFYRQEKGSKETVTITDVPYVRALNVDNDGKVYACSNDGIYKAIGHSAKFVKLVDDIKCASVTFDNDNNIIYSDSEAKTIIRLKPMSS